MLFWAVDSSFAKRGPCLIESHMPEEDRAISNVVCEFN
jgi:hypothetical protein